MKFLKLSPPPPLSPPPSLSPLSPLFLPPSLSRWWLHGGAQTARIYSRGGRHKVRALKTSYVFLLLFVLLLLGNLISLVLTSSIHTETPLQGVCRPDDHLPLSGAWPIGGRALGRGPDTHQAMNVPFNLSHDCIKRCCVISESIISTLYTRSGRLATLGSNILWTRGRLPTPALQSWRAISTILWATVRPRSSSGAPTATPNPKTMTCTITFPRHH